MRAFSRSWPASAVASGMFSTAFTYTDDDLGFNKAFSFTLSTAESTQRAAQPQRQLTTSGITPGAVKPYGYGIVQKEDLLLVPIQ